MSLPKKTKKIAEPVTCLVAIKSVQDPEKSVRKVLNCVYRLKKKQAYILTRRCIQKGNNAYVAMDSKLCPPFSLLG